MVTIVDFVAPANHKGKIKESEKRELKTMEHEGDGDTNCGWGTRDNPQRIRKRTGKLGN